MRDPTGTLNPERARLEATDIAGAPTPQRHALVHGLTLSDLSECRPPFTTLSYPLLTHQTLPLFHFRQSLNMCLRLTVVLSFLSRCNCSMLNK